MMHKVDRARAAFDAFTRAELSEVLSRAGHSEPSARALELFHATARSVPAYRAFLAEHGIDASNVQSPEDFARLPVTTKESYHKRFTLTELCRDGRLSDCDMLAVSSGSTGEPTVWPRFVTDELATATRFEQVLRDAYGAHERSTLCVICFALGTWVGGLYTAACCRHLALKGYPLTVVAPGNQKAEILRVLRALGGAFEQIVLFGYPPFLKDVVDSAAAEGFEWSRQTVRLVLAGEVFSESWRSLVAERLGASDPAYATASLYGTADGGVLANETPLSVRIRRALADAPSAARELFGEARLPTLCQYDPLHRYFELEADGSLLFTGDGGIPLIRYKILDKGGLVGFDAMRGFLDRHGIRVDGVEPIRELPFVFVFGRSNFALSYYGANVYPENVAVGVEQPEFAERVTGKFVMEIAHDADHDPTLVIHVELAPGRSADAALCERLAESIQRELERLNSEFANYAPADRRVPAVHLHAHADPNYFPLGVKHRYTRG